MIHLIWECTIILCMILLHHERNLRMHFSIYHLVIRRVLNLITISYYARKLSRLNGQMLISVKYILFLKMKSCESELNLQKAIFYIATNGKDLILTLFHPEGVYMTSPRFFQNYFQTAFAKTLKLCEF